MRRVLASIVFIVACGGTSNDSVDAPGGGEDSPFPGVDAPAGTSVALTLQNRPTNAAMFELVVAYVDGGGAWTVAQPPTGDTYILPIASDRYGYMWSCKSTNARVVSFGFYTVAEHPSITEAIPARCSDAIHTVTLAGTVTNRPPAGRLSASFGDVSTPVEAGSGAFKLDVVPGTADLVIAHNSIVGTSGTTPDVVIDAVALTRGLLVSGTTNQTIDFATAVPTQSNTVTVSSPNLQARSSAATTLYTANGTSVTLVRDTSSPLEDEALGAAQGATSDIYEAAMTLALAGQAATTSTVTATPAAQTFVAPNPLGGATSSTTAAPDPRITTTWQPYPNAVGYTWTAAQSLTAAQCNSNAACTVGWGARLSAAYLGTATTFAMPDLSMLAGFSADFDFVAGTVIAGESAALTSSAGASDFPALTPGPIGTDRTSVRASWSVTPM